MAKNASTLTANANNMYEGKKDDDIDVKKLAGKWRGKGPFTLKNHIEIYKRYGWKHGDNCICKELGNSEHLQ